MTSAQKKELAKVLFVTERLQQKEIAERVGVTPQTVSRWVTREGWEKLRASISMTKEEQLKALYRQIEELNNDIAQRSERRYPTTAESDIISKVSAAIKNLETEVGVSEIVSVFSAFTRWIKSYDLERAQSLAPLFDDFIKSRLQ